MERNPYESPQAVDEVVKESDQRPMPSWRVIWIGLLVCPLAMPLAIFLSCQIAWGIELISDLSFALFGTTLVSYLATVIFALPTVLTLRRFRWLVPLKVLLAGLAITVLLVGTMIYYRLQSADDIGRLDFVFITSSLMIGACSPTVAFAAWLHWNREPQVPLSDDRRSSAT